MTVGVVAITRTYEVECSECGLLSYESSKTNAEKVARGHRTIHHDKNWAIGGSLVKK